MKSPLIILGSILLIISGLFHIFISKQYVDARAVVVSERPISNSMHQTASLSIVDVSTAKQITSKDLGINAVIEHGSFDSLNNIWSLNDRSVFLAIGTTSPLLYGHNSSEVFAGLTKARIGSMFTITYKNHVKEYEYVATRFVAANENAVLYESNPADVIVLMTCSGAFDELRRIVYIKEVS